MEIALDVKVVVLLKTTDIKTTNEHVDEEQGPLRTGMFNYNNKKVAFIFFLFLSITVSLALRILQPFQIIELDNNLISLDFCNGRQF